MRVWKSGRSSGVTRGEVVALGTTINVGLGGGTMLVLRTKSLQRRWPNRETVVPWCWTTNIGPSGCCLRDPNKATLCNRITRFAKSWE